MKIALSVSQKEITRGAASPYFQAMLACGAKPEELELVSASDEGRIRADDFDGILFAGGEDVDPEFYLEPNRHADNPSRERDLFELGLLERALRSRLPVFGICRGAQMINVKYGGSLYQDLKSERALETENALTVEHRQQPRPRTEATHGVTVTDPETRLAGALQGSVRVNSMHHQGIRVIGRGLRVSARSEDGLIEAIEAADGGFLLAVQWHPEELTAHAEHRRIFELFIAECRAHAVHTSAAAAK